MVTPKNLVFIPPIFFLFNKVEIRTFKKFNSVDGFKKSLTIILNGKLKKNKRFFFQKFIRINKLFTKHELFVHTGQKFIKIFVSRFSNSFTIGSFCLTKKFNRHISLKKLRSQKR